MLRWGIVTLASLWLLGCSASNPAFFIGLDSRQESDRGLQRTAVELAGRYGGIERDALAEARMLRIAQQLDVRLPDLECRILHSQQRNAVSLPPGRIFITRGLYDAFRTDDELAAVIAHEVGHFVERDHYHPLHCGRAALIRECDADRYAIEQLAVAGYDPRAMRDVIEHIRGALSTEAYRQRTQAAQLALSESENLSGALVAAGR